MFTTIEDAHQTFSDLYKDANGIRPRFDWQDMTLDDFNESAKGLLLTIDRNVKEEKLRADASVKSLKDSIEAAANTVAAVDAIVDGR